MRTKAAATDQVVAIRVATAEVVEAKLVVVGRGPSDEWFLDDDTELAHSLSNFCADALHYLIDDRRQHVTQVGRLRLRMQLLL